MGFDIVKKVELINAFISSDYDSPLVFYIGVILQKKDNSYHWYDIDVYIAK